MNACLDKTNRSESCYGISTTSERERGAHRASSRATQDHKHTQRRLADLEESLGGVVDNDVAVLENMLQICGREVLEEVVLVDDVPRRGEINGGCAEVQPLDARVD